MNLLVARKNFSRRVIALALAALLCIWCVPVSAFAVEEGENGTQNTQTAAAEDEASDGSPTANDGATANDSAPSNGNPASNGSQTSNDSQASDGNSAGSSNSQAPADEQPEGAAATTTDEQPEGDIEITAEEADANSPFISTDPEVIEPGLYKIIAGVGKWKVLDVSGGATANGTLVQIYSSNNTPGQFFDIQPAQTEGYYTLRAVNAAKSLDLVDGGMDRGTPVQIWDSGINPNQEWAFYRNTSGGYTIISRTNHLALDVKGANPSNGTQVQTYTPNGTDAQNFTLKPVETLISEGIYQISPNHTSKVLDIDGGSRSGGANLQLWSSYGTTAQRFSVHATGVQNEFTIEALCSGLYLTQTDANVDQRPAIGTANQLWQAVPSSSGGLSLINKGSGLALDVAGASTADGANVRVYEPNGTPAQSFVFSKTSPIGDGTFFIGAANGLVLDVSNGSESDGANIQVWKNNNTGAQKWNIRQQSNGTYMILNAASNRALDVQGWSANAGANIQQWEAFNTLNQEWNIVYVGDGSFEIRSALGDGSLGISVAGSGAGANVQLGTVGESPNMAFRFTPTIYVPPIPESWRAMNDRVANIASSTNYLIAVDDTNCIVGIYQGSRGAWTRLATWPCSPGAWGTPTVKGIFRIQSRGYSFGTSSYTCYYWTQFYGNYLFHSVLYYPGSNSVKDGRLGMRLSHGCVRLAIENAQWINSNIPSGTTVVSY